MSYLAPPPMPAPVIVMKDVGGFVADYQAQTELYRASDREVRLHECRSACTMALSLPNVCVYPDSTLKFHLAYDVRNRQTDATISQQLFDSYPAAVRTRLGGLTRQYKVLRGSELIALGVRDCGERRVMVAASESRKRPAAPASAPAAQGSLLAGLMRNVASVFGGRGEQGRDKGLLARSAPVAKPAQEAAAATPPLPPARPIEVAESSAAASELAAKETMQEGAEDAAAAEQTLADAPAPPRRPVRLAFSYQHRQTPVALPQIIIGAQPILPPGFRAFAEFER